MSAKPLTLAIIRDVLPDGTMVPEVHATIKKVYPPKTGTYSKGKNAGQAWKIQNLVLMDKEGTELDCKLDNNEATVTQEWEGRDVIITSYEGDNKTTGVYAHDDSFDKKRKLRLTPTGDIALVDGLPNKPQQPHQPQKPQQQKPAAPAADPQETDTKPVDKLAAAMKALGYAKGEAYQVANLQLMALTTTEQYTAVRFKAKTGRDLTPEEKHAWAMNMAIDLVKAGVHRQMPACPMEDLEAEAKARQEAKKQAE